MKPKLSAPNLPSQLAVLAAPALEPALSLEQAELTGVNWAGQTAPRLQLDTVRLIMPDLTSAHLRDSGWIDTELAAGQLAGCDLTGCLLRRLAVSGSRLDGAVFVETEAKDVLIRDTKLDLANFRMAKWQRVHFLRCSLREADFAGLQLTDAVFTGCDLTGADFSGARLTRVDLRTSQLADLHGLAGLAGATIDSSQLMTLAPELAAALGLKIAA